MAYNMCGGCHKRLRGDTPLELPSVIYMENYTSATTIIIILCLYYNNRIPKPPITQLPSYQVFFYSFIILNFVYEYLLYTCIRRLLYLKRF
jgi:hypothetical protein